MKNLNENEKKVFTACVASANGNGYDFGWSDEVEVDGLTKNQIKGYLSSLQKKNLIAIEDDPTQDYDGQMEIIGAVDVTDYYKMDVTTLANELIRVYVEGIVLEKKW